MEHGALDPFERQGRARVAELGDGAGRGAEVGLGRTSPEIRSN
jgi:hypothetical protein